MTAAGTTMTEKKEEGQRVRQYAFSGQLILDIFRDGRIFGVESHYDKMQITEGIPEDAKIVGVDYISWNNVFIVVVEHESFDPVPEAVTFPTKIIRADELPYGEITQEIWIENRTEEPIAPPAIKRLKPPYVELPEELELDLMESSHHQKGS